MKRFLSLCLIAVLLLSMAGCKNAAANGAGDEQAVSDEIFETEEVSKKEEQSVVDKEPVEIPPVEQEPEVPTPPAAEMPTLQLSDVIPASTHTFEFYHLPLEEKPFVQPKYPTFTVLRSATDFEKFYFQFGELFDFTKTAEALKRYDEAYFEKQSLILIRNKNMSTEITGLHLENGRLEISLLNREQHNMGTADIINPSWIALEPDAALTLPQEIYLQVYFGSCDDQSDLFYELKKVGDPVSELKLSAPDPLPNHEIEYNLKTFVEHSDMWEELTSKPIIIRSKKEMDDLFLLKSEQEDIYFQNSIEKPSPFVTALKEYTEEYFQNRILMVLTAQVGSSSFSRRMTHVCYENGVLRPYIKAQKPEGEYPCDVVEYQFIVELDAMEITSVDAVFY